MSSKSDTLPWSAILSGFFAVALFSLTMPLMRLAVQDFNPTVVGVGRILISCIPAAIFLLIQGFPRLTGIQIARLCLITLCLVFGFAWLTAIALKTVDSHHAAIVTGGIPLATALFATIAGGQHPGWRFWVAAATGSLLVAGYGIVRAGGVLSLADFYLLAAATVCGLGYAEGTRLSSEIGTTQLTCLMPVAALPGALLICWGKWPAHWGDVHLSSWLAFLYNGLISAFGSFFLWYPALRKGGAARIGQIQLVQPFLTLASSVFLLGEKLAPSDWVIAAAVVGCVAAAQRARMAPKPTTIEATPLQTPAPQT